jgi:hypothetical protein
LPSFGVSHAKAQLFPGHYRRVYRRAARYGAYAAGATAGYYGYPSSYGYGWGGLGGTATGGYYGGYGVYGTPGMYRRAYRRAYRRSYY